MNDLAEKKNQNSKGKSGHQKRKQTEQFKIYRDNKCFYGYIRKKSFANHIS